MDNPRGMDARSINLAKNTIIFFIGSFSTKLLVFLLLPLYTNYLDPADYGLVDTYVNLLGVVYSIVSLQSIEMVFRFAQDAKTEREVSAVFSNTMVITVFGLVLFTLGMFAYYLLTGFHYAALFVVYVYGSVLSQYYLQLLRGLNKNISYAIAGTLSTLIQLLLNILLIAVLGRSADAILYSSAISYCVVILVLFFKTGTIKLFSVDSIDLPTIKRYLAYGIPLIPNAVCIWALASIGRYVILLDYGTYEVGIFSYASKFSQILGVVNSVFFMAWQQTAIGLQGRDDKNEYASNVLTAYINIQFGALLVLLPLVKVMVFTIMGSMYIEAWTFIPIFFVGILFSAYAHFFAVGFYMEKKTATVFISSFVGFVSYALFGVIFSHWDAVGGVAAAYVVSQLVYFLIMKHRVRPYLCPKVRMTRVVPAVVFLALVAVLYYVLPWEWQLLVLASGVVAFIVINKAQMMTFLLLAKKKFSKR